jgi:cob(I)alamin adenosyltransferase
MKRESRISNQESRSGSEKKRSRSQKRLHVSDHGLVIVYYGDGKGKTTAALGTVLRAVGQGWRCVVVQFIKGSWPSSERTAIPKYLRDLVTIEAGGKGFVGIVDDRLPRSEHKKHARVLFRDVKRRFAVWKRAWKNSSLQPHPPQLVVLDEILDALEFGFITQTELLALLGAKPEKMHLILTGHKKFLRIFAAADLVTKMVKEKHPYDEGFLAVRGVDF